MKTKILLLLIVSLSLLFLWTGCEKDPIVPDPEPTEGLTVKITPVNDTVVYVGETVEFLITTTADSISLFTNTGFTKTFVRANDVIGSANYTFSLPVIVSGRNELYGRFFKMGYDRITINRVVIGKLPLIELYSIPYAEEFPIPWRTSCSIKITSGGGDSLWTDLPGVNGLNGIFPTPVLDTTTTYHFRLFNTISGDVVEATETIFVKDPTREDTLSYKMGPWRMVKLEFKYLDGPWHEEPVSLCQSDDLVYYYLYPEKTDLYDMGEIPCFDGDSDRTGLWHLESNGTVLVTYQNVNQPGYSYRAIEALNDTTLVLIDDYGNGQLTKTTYNHP